MRCLTPRFSLIAKKLPIVDIREVSFENLANKSMPSEKERRALADWVEAHKACFQVGAEYAKEHYPSQIGAIAIEEDNRITAVIASLFNKEITYGFANKQIQSIVDDIRNRETAITEQVQQDKINQQFAQELTQKQQKEQESAKRIYDRRVIEQRQAQAEEQLQQQQAQEDAQTRQLKSQMLMNMINNNKPYQLPMPMPIRPAVRTNCSQFGNQLTCTTN